MPSTELKGKVAWITGGGSGIGLAGARELARAGAHVVISGRTARTNDSALAELKRIGSAEAHAARRRRPRGGRAHRRGHREAPRTHRHPRHQRRHQHRRRQAQFRHHVRGGLGRRREDQSQRLVLLLLRGDSRHARAQGRRHHQHLVLGRALRERAHRPGVQRHQARGDRDLRVDQHGGVHARHPRHLHPAGRGGHADPREAPGAALAGGARAHGAGGGLRQGDLLHRDDAGAHLRQRARDGADVEPLLPRRAGAQK